MLMMPRDVSSTLEVEVTARTELEFQIAVAQLPGLTIDESLHMVLGDQRLTPDEIPAGCGGRIHRLQVGPGRLTVQYRARIEGQAEPLKAQEYDRSRFLRPSRYAECDKFYGFVAGQFDLSRSIEQKIMDVSDFVAARLSYVPGSSDPIDGATDTLLAGAGVCRDYAHLVVALLRAMHIPARLVAVYAPGCDPMDFHAVAEAIVDGEWVAVDPTWLAPRQSLVRIATGRDAADTAFLDNHDGGIILESAVVTATVDGDLPIDQNADLIPIR
ncbi:transglutaminase-like domain-containing protein [Nesterenkonia haasae]|uniref:transglutaminase-like domain-containing protein n=1 Tax=Nesterenkonia haasae TaxID=2587813 RepID=UPI0013912AC1|nr:transglutaminase family protein [Nesterenkonia haasae]NDK31989.1 transglutaminase family protein [Nesterenkonia haasae]